MSKGKIWNIFFWHVIIKPVKSKSKLKRIKRVFTYHLGWMIHPPRRRTKLVVSAINSVSLCPWALIKFFICGLNLMIIITKQNENSTP
jgi:hypothetical protein